MLLKVALPEMNDPSAPMKGATSGQASPTEFATIVTSSIGMLIKSAPFNSELMKIRTIGTAVPNGPNHCF